jgi:anti-anti-sigma regulatory factor
VLVSPPDVIRRTLQLVDLEAVFEITDDASILDDNGSRVFPGDPGPG